MTAAMLTMTTTIESGGRKRGREEEGGREGRREGGREGGGEDKIDKIR